MVCNLQLLVVSERWLEIYSLLTCFCLSRDVLDETNVRISCIPIWQKEIGIHHVRTIQPKFKAATTSEIPLDDWTLVTISCRVPHYGGCDCCVPRSIILEINWCKNIKDSLFRAIAHLKHLININDDCFPAPPPVKRQDYESRLRLDSFALAEDGPSQGETEAESLLKLGCCTIRKKTFLFPKTIDPQSKLQQCCFSLKLNQWR